MRRPDASNTIIFQLCLTLVSNLFKTYDSSSFLLAPKFITDQSGIYGNINRLFFKRRALSNNHGHICNGTHILNNMLINLFQINSTNYGVVLFVLNYSYLAYIYKFQYIYVYYIYLSIYF